MAWEIELTDQMLDWLLENWTTKAVDRSSLPSTN
jgi:hypothetical protein